MSFGQRQLGMNAITPPWISCYLDGCEQRLHTDSPHGPWAFVMSLTPGAAFESMEGGETIIMKPQILDYWRGFETYGLEEGDIFSRVEPRFGRITCFDPRLPHGVRQVRGPRSMDRGRLVIHGWFSEPEPFLTGGLAPGDDSSGSEANTEEAAAALQETISEAIGALSGVGRVTGCLSTRLLVDGSTGLIKSVDALADTLVPDPEDFQGIIGTTDEGESIYEDARSDVLLTLHNTLSSAKFPAAPSGDDTEITVPFIFE